jgi:hypothetical protein
MHSYKSTYGLGETVYLKTDQEQRPRLVIALTIRSGGSESIYYELGCGPDSSFHFDMEITNEIDETVRLGLKEIEK